MATATATKPKTTPPAAAEGVIEMLNRMQTAQHVKAEDARKVLSKLVRDAADGYTVDAAQLAAALADSGETTTTFAHEVQGLIKRRASVRQLLHLRHVADMLIPGIKAEAEQADQEFRKVREAHEKKVHAILAKINPLQNQIDTAGFHQRWNAVFGRGTPKTLTVRAALHKAEVELAKVRETRDHWEAKSGATKLYSVEVLAEAKAAFTRHKGLVAAGREKVEELKRQLEQAERDLVTSDLRVARYDTPLDPPQPVVGSGSLFPASAFGGSGDELVPVPAAPVVKVAG